VYGLSLGINLSNWGHSVVLSLMFMICDMYCIAARHPAPLSVSRTCSGQQGWCVCKVTGFGFAEHVREREEYERTKGVSDYLDSTDIIIIICFHR
jgi:hypothetical protein